MDRLIELGQLFDYYGAFLTERQRGLVEAYANDNLSLGEIAEREGISRQGVHDTISRTEAILRGMEEATGCLRQAEALRRLCAEVEAAAQPLLHHEDPTVRQCAGRIFAAVSSVKE